MWRTVLLLGVFGCTKGLSEGGEPVCDALLACPEPIEVECTDVVSPIAVPDASVCDAASTTDTRLAGYPLGETVVAFASTLYTVGVAREATCLTTVTLVDETPPVVTCESEIVLTRTDPEDPIADSPQGTAVDLCDSELDITVSPATLAGSVTNVTTTATDDAGNRHSCETRVRLLDIFAVPDMRLLGARLTHSDATELTLGWEPVADDTDEVVLQRSTSATGPWEDVLSVASTRQTISGTQTSGSWYRLQSMSSGYVGGATGAMYVHAVAREVYDVRDVSIPGIGFDTTLYGVVRYPADLSAGPYPLVLLMHGNHGNCRRDGTTSDSCATTTDHDCDFSGYSTTPNAEGMTYQAEMLAARGMVAATVSANAMNCRSGYILERARLLRAHLEAWSDWQKGVSGDMGTRFASTLDLSRVGLVGHSRGGDAVAHVPQMLSDAPIPGVDVTSIFSIAPTDYNDATVFESAWALLLPACDGDVSSLWGVDIYERSRDTVWHKSQLFIPGANHNYFSSEWYTDDGRWACESSDLIGWEPQMLLMQATLGSWMTHTLEAEEAPERFQRGEVTAPTSIDAWAGRTLDTRWSYTHDGTLLVDSFTGEETVNALGEANTYTDFRRVLQCTQTSCSDGFIHDTSAVRLNWNAGSSAIADFTIGGNAAEPYDALSFRVTSPSSSLNNGRSEQAFSVVFVDGDENIASFNVRERTPVYHLYDGFYPRAILQTVRIPFADVEAANPAMDTTRLERVSLDFTSDGLGGSVIVTDLALGY